MTRKKRSSEHYVNNAEFSNAVVEYVKEVKAAKAANEPIPQVTDYIATCFLRIAEGLSHKQNFIRYSFREELVMDAVENCLKAIENYNIDAATRTGKPNAFAYFTQISWYAFLRRIEKEKKQMEIKLKYMTSSGVEEFIMVNGDDAASHAATHFVDTLRDRIDKVKVTDYAIKEFKKNAKRKKRDTRPADSNLEDFIEDDTDK